ncbi:hypothetical protein llap_14832 [Limosa lapponica baueri]|uniref:Uncharacterized protein n=1 Tax=Limosa lapponica baueri TaxID=1758121 RepID=A0A2I0TMA9_LIMLA|nr:hypothetical protein llap_14832 [Limosa lapponica baueri]
MQVQHWQGYSEAGPVAPGKDNVKERRKEIQVQKEKKEDVQKKQLTELRQSPGIVGNCVEAAVVDMSYGTELDVAARHRFSA